MSEEFKIEVGEPIPNTFDYFLAPSELDKELSERMEKAKSGEVTVTQEYAMLGYGLDFIDFAKDNMNVTIAFDEASLGQFCEILSQMQKLFAQNTPPADYFNTFVKKAAGFFGIVVIKHIGGNWAQSNLGMAVTHNGKSAFVMNRIGRFLQGGDGDDMNVFYNYLKTEF